MSQQWFYTKDGKTKLGPYTSAELRALAQNGQLLATDMVLQDGTTKWAQAGRVKGLFTVVSSGDTTRMPEIPAEEHAITQTESGIVADPEFSSLPQSSPDRVLGCSPVIWLFAMGIVGCTIVAGLALAIVFLRPQPPNFELACVSEFSIVERNNQADSFTLKLTVAAKGKIADNDKFSLVLTHPNGRSEKIADLGKDNMVVGSFDTEITQPTGGVYTVAIKNRRTDAVECKKELRFNSDAPTVENVAIKFSKKLANRMLRSIDITLRNDGDLPLIVKDASFEERGQTYSCPVAKAVLPKESASIALVPAPGPNKRAREPGELEFLPPYTCSIRGRLNFVGVGEVTFEANQQVLTKGDLAQLREILTDKSDASFSKIDSLKAIAFLGDAGADAAMDVARLLALNEPATSAQAITTLEKINRLIKVANDSSDPALLAPILRALRKNGNRSPEAILCYRKQLQHSDENVADLGALAMLDLDADALGLDQLATLTDWRDEVSQRANAIIDQRLRKPKVDDLPALRKGLKNHKVRVAFLDAIASLGEQGQAATPDVVALLDSSDAKTIDRALGTLQKTGQLGSIAQTELPPKLLLQALTVLKNGSQAENIFQAYEKHLWHKEREVAACAASALLQHAPDRIQLDSLVKLMAAPEESIKKSAADVLAKKDVKTRYSALLQALNQGDPKVQDVALTSLQAERESPPISVLDAIGDGLKHKEKRIRLYCLKTLHDLGANAKPTAPRIHSLLANSALDRETREQAIKALGRIGRTGESVEALAAAIVRSDDLEDTSLAVLGSWKLSWTDADALNTLLDVDSSKRPKVRAFAMKQLEEIPGVFTVKLKMKKKVTVWEPYDRNDKDNDKRKKEYLDGLIKLHGIKYQAKNTNSVTLGKTYHQFEYTFVEPEGVYFRRVATKQQKESTEQDLRWLTESK